MSRRIIHDNDFIEYVMTPPTQEEYTKNHMKLDVVKVSNGNRCTDSGLGQLPTVGPVQGMFGGNDWVMPVVIIVVSAMALMTLYSVLKR